MTTDLGVVRADPGRLQQVIWNLLSNAVKFTPQGGSVNVSARRDGAIVTIELADTGVGIKREFLPHVFDRFRQAEVGAARAHGGLGLGLAIAKQIVELHGGTISVFSQGDGQGSTFRVELPLPVSAGVDDTSEIRTVNLAPHLNEVDILLVEDEANAREVMQRLLQEHGAKVRAVESAAEARDAIEMRPPRLIISDIGLPGEDGYAFIRGVRTNDPGAQDRRARGDGVRAARRSREGAVRRLRRASAQARRSGQAAGARRETGRAELARLAMRNFDFSSWQGVLSTLLGLAIITLLGVGIRLLIMQTVQQRRERENRQINERLRTLIAAYKTLGGSFTGDLAVDPTHLRDLQRRTGTAPPPAAGSAFPVPESASSDRSRRIRDAVEAALSDIILLGTEEQVRLAAQAANELVAGRPVHTAELVVSLRSFIRSVLDLDPLATGVAIPKQGPARPGTASGGGKRGENQDGGRGGGNKGGGDMAAGAGMGMGVGLGGVMASEDDADEKR